MGKNKKADEILNQDIIAILGNPKLSEEEKSRLYEKMVETIKYRVLDRISNSLNDDDFKSWMEAIDSGSKDKIDSYLISKGVDFERLMLDETVRYKIEVAAMVEYLKESGKTVTDYYKLLDQTEEKKDKSGE